MSVVVLLEVQVKPEEVDNIKAYFKEILPDTRAYEGCQSIDMYGNLDESTNLVLYECWESRQYYEKYLAWRNETGVVEKLGSMLSGPPSIRYYERVEA